MSLTSWLGGSKTKDLFGTLSPSVLGAGVVYIYFFPFLPTLDSLFILSFLTVIIAAVLTSLSSVFMRFFMRPSHFVESVLKQGQFEKLESHLKRQLRQKNHSLIKDIRKTYEESIKSQFTYESERIELERHKGVSNGIYQALNLKEVKLLNLFSILVISGLLTILEVVNIIYSLSPNFFNNIVSNVMNILLGQFSSSLDEMTSSTQIDPLIEILRAYLPIIAVLISLILLIGILRERGRYQSLYMDLFTFVASTYLPPLNEIDFELECLDAIAKEQKETGGDSATSERVKLLNTMKSEVRQVQTRRKVLLREVESELRPKFEKNLNIEELNIMKRALERTYVAIVGDTKVTPRDKIRSTDSHLIREGITYWVEHEQHEALLANAATLDISDFARQAIFEALKDQKVKYSQDTISEIISRLRESQDPELLSKFLEWISQWEDPALGDQIWNLAKQNFFKDVSVIKLIPALFQLNPTSLHNGSIIQQNKFYEMMNDYLRLPSFEKIESSQLGYEKQKDLLQLWVPKDKNEDLEWLKQRLNGTHAFLENLLRQDKELVTSYSWLFKSIYVLNDLISEESVSRASSHKLLNMIASETHSETINLCFRTLAFLRWHHIDRLGQVIQDIIQKDLEIVKPFLDKLFLIFFNPNLLHSEISFEDIQHSPLKDKWDSYLRRAENAQIRNNPYFTGRGQIYSFVRQEDADNEFKKTLIYLTGLVMRQDEAWSVLQEIWKNRSGLPNDLIGSLYVAIAYLGRGEEGRMQPVINFLQNQADHTLASEDTPSIRDLIEYVEQATRKED